MIKLNAWFHRNTKLSLLFGAILVFVAGMSLMYFTPLKYNQLIEPKINDIDSRAIAPLIAAHPEDYDFIDVRGVADYDNLHAVGSRNIPLYKMYFERLVLPKKDKEIVLICSKGTASGVAYMYLEHFGFRNVVRIDGGIENWQAFGLPTESNAR